MTNIVTFNTAYKPHPPKRQFFKLPSRTKQSFKDECNINTILHKYQKTGLVDHVAKHAGRYDDLGSSADYHTALNTVLAARESFESLTSSIRSKFFNDPASFLEFVQNPDNHAELVKLGLAKGTPANAHEARVDETNTTTTNIENSSITQPVDQQPSKEIGVAGPPSAQ